MAPAAAAASVVTTCGLVAVSSEKYRENGTPTITELQARLAKLETLVAPGPNATTTPPTTATVATVELAVTGPTAADHVRPALVLVHGLDSTRLTWTGFIQDSGAPALRLCLVSVNRSSKLE
jgi:hypothetical protein